MDNSTAGPAETQSTGPSPTGAASDASGAHANQPAMAPLKNLGQRVCRYFLDFLETDFKRQQAPRRRILGRTDAGQPTSIDLRKYRTLYDHLWRGLAKPYNEFSRFSIGRNTYTAQLSAVLRELIRKHVAAIDEVMFEEARRLGIEQAIKDRAIAPKDIEKYVDDVVQAMGTAIDRKVVRPLLAILEEPVKKQAYSPLDSIYEIEADLLDALLRRVEEHLSGALTTFAVDGKLDPLKAVLEECLSGEECKNKLTEYLESLATADIYQELRELYDFLRTQEQGQAYLYVCDFRFESNLYPLLYVPLTFEFDKEKSEFSFAIDPHLYVNKRALDFALQEIGSRLQKILISPIDDRILYLDENRPLIDEIDRVLSRVQSVLSLDSVLNVREGRLQSASSTAIRLSTSLHIAVFDKSDESLLNDYEAILSDIQNNGGQVGTLFERFVESCITENPIRLVSKVNEAWGTADIPTRLVAESPIPLNEEQRRLLIALREPNCRFVVVHGPPGSGKSHTITAIAFDCILSGKNVLILSDKKEALDVVEDKLTQTLQKIRATQDFQNPILRLGRAANNYPRLLREATLDKIRFHHEAAKANASHLAAEIESRSATLKANIASTVHSLSEVKLAEIDEFFRLEQELEARFPGLCKCLEHPAPSEISRRLLKSAHIALSHESIGTAEAILQHEFKGHSLADFLLLVKIRTALHQVREFRSAQAALLLFRGLDPAKGRVLEVLIGEYEALRMPLFGYLFRGRQLEALNQRFLAALPCEVNINLHKRLKDFRIVREALKRLEGAIEAVALPTESGSFCYDELREGKTVSADLSFLCHPLEDAVALAESLTSLHFALVLDPRPLGSVKAILESLVKIGRYSELWTRIRSTMDAAPRFDAVGSRSVLEELYAQRMAHEMDARFIKFVDGSYATARSLSGVIRGKKQFPTDTFGDLKNAFPCVIASIREFAEYIPLRQDLFDVVVVDEASQVSVAQAFPALLRCKQIVVFGDPKQFSNVKSANASIAQNQTYLSDIRGYFQQNISRSAEKLERLSHFDVKKSILEFIELVANYSIMLKKHFRGYQELINFSSRYFYDGALQAIKVRGKPLEDVIRFTVLPQDKVGVAQTHKNTNQAECEFIRSCLDDMLLTEAPPTVGIITPFREQQLFLTRELFKSENASMYEDKLRLKIMTFDSCQGEERDVIFYSMVATLEHDVLNYIFPVDLAATKDRVEDALKVQRLNVGFSRAKECIHFVLSKDIDKFGGSVARVLQHYLGALKKEAPSPDEVDPASPMEKNVLDWLLKTPFYQRHSGHIELRPQFPIGDYLRQLDPHYIHPRYRVDFLLTYTTIEDVSINIVLEYDGFQEHFVEHGKVHDGNYERYYRPQDVERQMILESYGYKFLRINRFNLGVDPIQSLSDRLYALVDIAQKEERSGVLERITTQVEGQEDGSWKTCKRCEKLKKLDEFFDGSLKGGYGRICTACKESAKQPRTSSLGSPGYRRWRTRRT